MKKIYLLLFLIIVSYSKIIAGQSKIDSLKSLLIKKNSITLKMKTLEKLYYLEETENKKLERIKQLQSLSQKYKSEFNFAIANRLFGDYFMTKTDKNNAVKYTEKSLQQFHKLEEYDEVVKSENLLGRIYIHFEEYPKAESHFLEALKYSNQVKDSSIIGTVYSNLGTAYKRQGNSDNSMKCLIFADKIYENLKNYDGIVYSKYSIGYSYLDLGQNSKAEKYLLLALADSSKVSNSQYHFMNNHALGILYSRMGKIKEAIFHNNQALSYYRKIGDKLYEFDVLNNMSNLYSNNSQFNSALKYNELALNVISKTNYTNYKYYTIINKARILEKLGDYKNSEIALNIIIKDTNNSELIDFNAKGSIYEMLYKISFHKKDYKKAFEYHTIFKFIDDSIYMNTLHSKEQEIETKYQTEKKESQIKSQQLEIEKQKNNRNLATGGIGFLLFTAIVLWYYIRNRQANKDLQSKNELLQLKQNFQTMEIQNLNQQLSPHEVKNMLASISPEIQEKAPDSYKKLIKLLNLTLASLNSEDVLDSLKNQVNQIEDLLFLEKNMLGDKLTYSIKNSIEDNINIPRLLLKNLVENAIKHGIKPKEDGGNVTVDIVKINNYVSISVEDNGTGRIVKQTKDTGIGTSTYRKLFDILNQKNSNKASFEIIDLPQGTKIEVKIPYTYKY